MELQLNLPCVLAWNITGRSLPLKKGCISRMMDTRLMFLSIILRSYCNHLAGRNITIRVEGLEVYLAEALS